MTLLPKARIDAFFSNSVFIFLTRFFPAAAALLVQVIYSRQLSNHDYGQYQNFWIHLYIFAAIASAGLHVFIITYPPEFLIRSLYKLKPIQYGYYMSWLLICAACFGYMQLSSGSELLTPFLFLAMHVMAAIAESALMVFKRFKSIATINLLYALVFCILHWMVIKGAITLQHIFSYILLLIAIKLVIYVALIRAYVLSNKHAAFEKEVVTSGVGRLWFHLGLYDFIQVLTRWIDKFVISLLFAEQVSAIYFNGAVDIPFLPLILGAAGSAALIQLAGKQDQREPDYTIALAHRSARILSCIIFPLFFFFVLFRYELFEVVFTNKFLTAVPIFLASSLAIPLRAYSFSTVLQNRNKGKIINAGAILDLSLALLLMYPFYQLWGLAGIAFSFTFATYVQAFFYLYYTGEVLQVKMYKLIPFKNWLYKLIIFSILLIATYYICTMLFTKLIVLILGMAVTAVVIIGALLLELKNQRKGDVA